MYRNYPNSILYSSLITINQLNNSLYLSPWCKESWRLRQRNTGDRTLTMSFHPGLLYHLLWTALSLASTRERTTLSSLSACIKETKISSVTLTRRDLPKIRSSSSISCLKGLSITKNNNRHNMSKRVKGTSLLWRQRKNNLILMIVGPIKSCMHLEQP